MTQYTAQEIVEKMNIGWNLGNSLDVCNADRNESGIIDEHAAIVDETLWGNVMTTKALFDHLKADGINAVRIPITWRDHLGKAPTYMINNDWMDRVEEVVRYAYDNDMFVIINVHHDGGGDPNFGAWIRSASDATKRSAILKKFESVWQQIADRFEHYGHRLILESMNEIGFDDMAKEEAFDLLQVFNQKFVDVIRSSNGHNSQRHLLIAGYWTDIAKTSSGLFEMPTDTIENRLILSVHYYTPWQFCVTNKQHTWGTSEEITEMKNLVQMIYDHFTAKGVPVIIGEYGFGPNDPTSTVFFTEMFVKLCYDKGIATFLWDNGEQYHRREMYWQNPDLIASLQRATSGTAYTVTKK